MLLPAAVSHHDLGRLEEVRCESHLLEIYHSPRPSRNVPSTAGDLRHGPLDSIYAVLARSGNEAFTAKS